MFIKIFGILFGFLQTHWRFLLIFQDIGIAGRLFFQGIRIRENMAVMEPWETPAAVGAV